jgi:hypothetical protein
MGKDCFTLWSYLGFTLLQFYQLYSQAPSYLAKHANFKISTREQIRVGPQLLKFFFGGCQSSPTRHGHPSGVLTAAPRPHNLRLGHVLDARLLRTTALNFLTSIV